MKATFIYPNFRWLLLRGSIGLMANDVRVMLVTAKYQPSVLHTITEDIDGEATGKSYTAGGMLLEGKAIRDVGGNAAFFANDLVWPKSTIGGVSGLVLYGGGTGDLLIAYGGFAQEISSFDHEFRITWSPEGILILGSK